jgi:hypothetical protein
MIGCMGALLITLGIALIAAAVVVVVANALGDDRGQVRSFLHDLRSGLRRTGADRAVDATPVDVPLTDLLEPRPAADDGYLHADELLDLVNRARQSLPGRSTPRDGEGTGS